MSESEYRLLRITIQLKKLILGVKFPCSISFQLKNCNFPLMQKTITSKLAITTNSEIANAPRPTNYLSISKSSSKQIDTSTKMYPIAHF